MATFTLTVPFLDDSLAFAAGVEFGLLIAEMRACDAGDLIDGYFLTVNQEQITLAANRLGWRILRMRLWKKAPDEWVRIRMRRT